MNLGRWLRGATRIRFDDRTGSNLLRNAGTIGGAALGGPAGLALAAGGNMLGRGVAKGANFGNIVGAGLTGAATAGALNAGTGLLRSAVSRIGSSASSATAPSLDALSTKIPDVSTIGSGPLPSMSAAAPVADVATAVAEPASQGMLSRTLSAVGKNPLAVGMGLQAAGGLATSGSQNRLNDLQADEIERRADESEYDFERRRRRDEALAPIWSNLGNMNGGYGDVATNPYLPRGG